MFLEQAAHTYYPLSLFSLLGVIAERGQGVRLQLFVAGELIFWRDDLVLNLYARVYSASILCFACTQEKKTAWDYNVNTPLKPRKPVYTKK